MSRSENFEADRPPPPPELAHMFNPSEHFEWSVVKAHHRDPVPIRHGVYDNPGDAELHIAKLRVQGGGAHPNLKVIMQPQGTAYRDLMDGRIKMHEDAAWPAAPKGKR